jgi:hypothetical protein
MIFFTKFYIFPPFFFAFFIIDNHLSFPLIPAASGGVCPPSDKCGFTKL